MTIETAHIFLDTNAFLQLRDLSDLPWKDLFGGARVILLVGPTVLAELDAHKVSTNRRRRDRARAALQMIERASLEPQFRLALRELPVAVDLAISDAPAPDWSAHPRLDPNRADDRLVAEALAHNQGSVLLSHDAGPRIRARLVGLAAVAPPDSWLLPAEQTDDQRRISSLERALEASLNARPRIEISLPQAVDGLIEFARVQPPPLGAPEVLRLTEAFLARHPHATSPERSRRLRISAPSSAASLLRDRSPNMRRIIRGSGRRWPITLPRYIFT